MSNSSTPTKEDLHRIYTRIYQAGKRENQRHNRARLTAIFGHIGFCLGLVSVGMYITYMILAERLVSGFPQWYVTAAETIRSLIPEFAHDNILEMVFCALLPLAVSFVFALLGKIFGVFVSGDYYSSFRTDEPVKAQAECLREEIKRVSWGRLTYDNFYPTSDHMINLYNFIPWLSFAAAFAICAIIINADIDDISPIFAMPVLFTVPIALLWRLSAIIDSVYYPGRSKVNLYSESKQLNDYLAPYDEEQKKRQEQSEAEAAAIRNARRVEAAEKRDRALEAESRGLYSLAKSLFREAAEMGDALAMDNYARHCLINGDRSEAIRWLQKCIDTGEADPECRDLLRALKNGTHIDATYCG